MAYYFPSSQAHGLQYARTLVQVLSNNLLDFSNFDSQRFTAQFIVDFASAIMAAENIQDDETTIDQQSIKTEAVENVMIQARKQFQELKYFVQKAFPNNINIWSKFGFDDYNEIRANAIKMIPFLLKVYKIANENRITLNVQGCLDSRIDAFDTLYRDLANAVTDQELSKNDRTLITQTRHDALDYLFDNFVTPTREVGKLIYVENNAMQALFLLPKRSSSTTQQSTNIAANTKSAVFQDIEPSDNLEIKNTGTTILVAYIAIDESAPMPTNAITIPPDTTQMVVAQDITAGAGSTLVIWNQGNITGSYRITELES